MGCFENQRSSVLAYVLFVFLFLCLLIPKAVAQPPSPRCDQFDQCARLSPPLAVIVIVLIASLFFMAAFSIYIRHCTQAARGGGSVRLALSMRRRAAAARGLDASVIETFPTFTYAEVKDHHIGKGALECAVCLNEFEDGETLRLIPKCDHVFHPECIDAWLQAHDTCPVCRADLKPKADEPPVPVPELGHEGQEEPVTAAEQQTDQVSIRIDGDEEQREQVQQREEGSFRRGMKRILSFNVPNRVHKQEEGGSVKPAVNRSSSMRLNIVSKFRSHSTGHSLVVPGENLDRYTLRLPDGVRKEVMNRANLNRAKSFALTLPTEASSRKGYRTGVEEGSNKGARSNRRIERSEPESKSDRWIFSMAPPFFSRGSSMKSPKVGGENGEGSASGTVKTAVKLPSFKCLEPKDDETSLMSADSRRPPV